MKLFIDCEFNGYQGALISMALVPEMGEPFYHVLNTDGVKIDPWVRENVMDRLIYNHRGDYAIRKAYRDCGYADKPSDEQIVIMLDVLEEAKKKAIEERDIAVGMLAEWVNAVENNGTGWDDWDEHYKDAAFRKNPIRNLLDKAINRKIEE